MPSRGLLPWILAGVLGTWQVDATDSENEAYAHLHLKVFSKAEIMAHMSREQAQRVVLGMNSTQSNPELLALLEDRFGKLVGGRSRKSTGHSLQRDAGPDKKKGYSAVGGGTIMLNTMMSETSYKLENEEIQCTTDKKSLEQGMEEARLDVISFNAAAAEARGRILKAKAAIATLEVQIPSVRAEFEQHKKECKRQIKALKDELQIVTNDIKIMVKILGMTQCTSSAPNLVQCRHCRNPMMVQEGKIQPLLNKLHSKEAREFVQRNLAASFDETAEVHRPMALTQEGVRHMRRLVPLTNSTNFPLYALNVSDVPKVVEPIDCIPTTKCSIANSPNCARLRDRFLVIQTGIADKKTELDEDLDSLETYCEETSDAFSSQLDLLELNLRNQQTDLAIATKDQNEAEANSRLKGKQHAAMLKEYTTKMTKCCKNQNDYKSEICALLKIRGELLKLEGVSTMVTNCEVADWRERECSLSCGGGTMKKTRAVLVHPTAEGVPCPPLEMTVTCNDFLCPTDCVVSDWEGWSSCSALCGGGVRERTRSILVEPENKGEPCEATSEEQPCSVWSCDEDCELSEWSEWTSCSKAALVGHQRRTRSITVAKRGDGKCWEWDDEKRLEFKSCNDITIPELCNRDVLMECHSAVDIIVVVDGSASLGQAGWSQTKAMAQRFIGNLVGVGPQGQEQVRVALQMFSGPESWDDYEACTGASEIPTTKPLNMSAQCGIHWISHLTNDTASVAEQVTKMEWPKATTLTSAALSESEGELLLSRESANAVVIVITDGWPMSKWNTKVAALKLQAKARVIWVPVGMKAPREFFEELASKPVAEHIVDVDDFDSMATNDTLNAIMADSCTMIKCPPVFEQGYAQAGR